MSRYRPRLRKYRNPRNHWRRHLRRRFNPYNYRRRNVDPEHLLCFNKRKRWRGRRNVDPERLLCFNKRKRWRGRRNVDPERLLCFNKRRNVDPERLLCFNKRRNVDPSRLLAFRKNRCQCSCHRKRNPAPDGSAWGPNLYNPLIDKKHEFKDERHYKRLVSNLHRYNPYWRWR
jgi:hypothetical protein